MKFKIFGKLPTILFITFWLTGTVLAQVQKLDNLILQLSDKDPAKNHAAVEALISSEDSGVVDALVTILKDPQQDYDLRSLAANILGQRKEVSVVPELIALLEHDLKNRTGSWSYLIPVLGMLRDQRATPLLLCTLNDRSDDWMGREMSARALGMIGDHRAVDHLINAAWVADTRGDAIQALAQIGDPKSIDVLISALRKEEEPDIAEAAEQGLVRMGQAAAASLSNKLKERPPEDTDNSYYRRIKSILKQIGTSKK